MPARVCIAHLPDLFAQPDRALVGRFLDARDEAAFATLVRRHAGMVLGVCRRVLRDGHLAEDAFQAVFVVLARNPAAAARSSSVAGWLFGVARRVGLAARRAERRRKRHEWRAGVPAERVAVNPPGSDSPDFDDLLRVLDEELAALPDGYRAPLVACFLREQTQDEAARELGWSLSTLRRRLERGKELLRSRLTRRGVTLPAALLAGAAAAPPVSAKLVEATSGLVRGTVPGPVAALARAAAGSPGWKLAAVAGVLLAAGAAAGVAGYGVSREREASGERPPAAQLPAAEVVAPVKPREWVLLKGRVVFPEKREVPKPREILFTDGFVKDRDYFFSQGRQFFEDLLVEPKTRGIRNAVVWLQPDEDNRKAPFPKEKIRPGLMEKPREHVIDTGCCQFTPRVVAGKAGDTLRFVNRAPVAHNVNYFVRDPGDQDRAVNVLLPANQGYAPGWKLPGRRTMDQYQCNIHTWMKGFVWSFDHPYAAVTDAEGNFTIPDAPVGTWRLVIWQEKVGYKGWNERRLGELVKVTDGPGAATDLGTVPLETGAWDDLKKGD